MDASVVTAAKIREAIESRREGRRKEKVEATLSILKEGAEDMLKNLRENYKIFDSDKYTVESTLEEKEVKDWFEKTGFFLLRQDNFLVLTIVDPTK